MAQKILEVKDLRISFRTANGKVQAVRDISFDMERGETLCIVGESGSGKSVTSRAILGILAGNAIVEGGNILYGGQDLLQISEDDFHKIRGDKIAMIFQDPLSSLNPIVKIGKQLTEAMILKNRASRKAAKKEFKFLLSELRTAIVAALELKGISTAEASATVDKFLVTFKKFTLVSIKLEDSYNESKSALAQAKDEADFFLLNYEKKQKTDFAKSLKSICKYLSSVKDGFILKGELAQSISSVLACNAENVEATAEALYAFLKAFDAFKDATEPNFFTIGYYASANPTEDIFSKDVDELNATARKVIDEQYMLEFIEHIKLGLEYSENRSKEVKKTVLEMIAADNCSTSAIAKTITASIDPLQINKESASYTYAKSMANAIKKYNQGVKNNPKSQKKYDKQKAKYDALVARGKSPDWKVTPAQLVDLELAKSNIDSLTENIVSLYTAQLESSASTDYTQRAVEFVDYLKDCNSRVVYKVTPRMAKLKAIKLMEEVGIPEPRKRYKQYPFEFSGGMRQRIVIAIALAANPDILICDEPTTALDVTIQSQILELINKLKKERKLTVIFITHDLGVVANMADKVAVMYAGKIVEYGDVNDIFYTPAHPYTWALLSSMPDLDTHDKLEAIPGTPPNMIYPPQGDAFAPRNKYALKIDLELQPPMFKISDTHYAATWLLHPDAPKVEPPKMIMEKMEKYAKMQEEQNEKQ